jgi:SAM-dependent methyltransferase
MRKERQLFIEKNLDISKTKMLEIGAFDYPTYTKDRADIYFMDWFSPEEHLIHHISAPERAQKAIAVDYVVKDKNFSNRISETFDLVIANHVVEHIPDPIRWFYNISRILNRNGYLFLAVPHKEYTFDKIRYLTSCAEIIRGYHEDLGNPTVYQVFDHLYYTRPIRANNVWNDEDCQELLERKRIATAKIAMEKAEAEIEKHGYVDIHCNVFNYESFLDIFSELYTSQYVDLQILDSEDVSKGDNEFYVIFQKKSDS